MAERKSQNFQQWRSLVFDPVTISTFVGASKALIELKGHFVSEEKKEILRFVEFCDSVRGIIQLASNELKRDNPDALGQFGARLNAWAGPDKILDPALKEQRDNLRKSINDLSSEMMKLSPEILSGEARLAMQKQLKLLYGHLEGLAEVLRFESNSSPAKAESGLRKSNWTKWLKVTVGPAVGILATTTAATAAEYIPGVGPVIAGYIRGPSDVGDA
jgi:hypothetical protein